MTVKLVKEITSRKIQKSAKVVRSLGSRGYFFKPWAHPKLPCEQRTDLWSQGAPAKVVGPIIS